MEDTLSRYNKCTVHAVVSRGKKEQINDLISSIILVENIKPRKMNIIGVQQKVGTYIIQSSFIQFNDEEMGRDKRDEVVTYMYII